MQARTLLETVGARGRVGRRMVAFYGCLYYAGMRPEEAVGLERDNLAIPASGWGEFILDGANPHAGREWTNSGENRDDRPLKQREHGTTRHVPCPPPLTQLINQHIKEFGFARNGRLFVGDRNHHELPKGTINRVWREPVKRRSFRR